jgi:hypothetical protein
MNEGNLWMLIKIKYYNNDMEHPVLTWEGFNHHITISVSASASVSNTSAFGVESTSGHVNDTRF